jgi:hypothetical protein
MVDHSPHSVFFKKRYRIKDKRYNEGGKEIRGLYKSCHIDIPKRNEKNRRKRYTYFPVTRLGSASASSPTNVQDSSDSFDGSLVYLVLIKAQAYSMSLYIAWIAFSTPFSYSHLLAAKNGDIREKKYLTNLLPKILSLQHYPLIARDSP